MFMSILMVMAVSMAMIVTIAMAFAVSRFHIMNFQPESGSGFMLQNYKQSNATECQNPEYLGIFS